MTSSFLHTQKSSEPCLDFPADPAQTYTFPLDPFQQKAIAAISKGCNVLVTAKTGSGKTLVGEYQIAHSLRKGGRVFYTTPIKSLSNQKFYDLKKLFPDRVGIMTGDLKYKPDADVVIMTTEILRNLLYKRGTSTETLGITAALSLNGLDAVVFDECHYINDKDRGSIWEETMILLNPSVQLVLLSATVDAPEVFASWLGELKQRPIHLISTDYRIVPLIHGVYKDKEFNAIMDNTNKFSDAPYRSWLQWRSQKLKAADQHKAAVASRTRAGYDGGPIARVDGPKAFTHEMNAMIATLEEKQQLPALFFVFSRKDCQRYADLTEHTLINSSDAASVRHIMDFHLHSYGEQLQRIPEYHTMRALLEKGIAYHHSGVIPILKECIEILFARGLVKVLFATETFAVGINMPTKTVVFTGFRKYDDTADRMRIINTDEYIQMAGRAGRRGKDERGYIVYLPDREPETIETMRAMMTGRSSTFQSRMKFDYDFILKTFQAGTLRWMDLLQSSYWNIGHTKECRESQAEIDKERAVIESVDLSETERAEMMEHKSIQEKLRTAVNAARRNEQRNLEVWNNRHMGPRWYKIIHDIWPKYQRAIERVQLMEDELAEKCDPAKFITPNLLALRQFGFLEAGLEDKMTPIGVMATEVNEGHTILMPLAYMDTNIRSLLKTKEDIITFLAIFLGERGEYNGMEVGGAVRASLRILKDIAITCQEKERRAGASSPYNYWQLNADFVEIIWRFVNGEELGILLQDYELFGGNFTRLISKMTNILREWTTLATLSSDVETLAILSDAEKLLEIGTMGSESLYLRLA
jgi:superfamily II RNA helicase